MYPTCYRFMYTPCLPCICCPFVYNPADKIIKNTSMPGLYRHHKKQKVDPDIAEIIKLLDCFYPGLGKSKYINCLTQAELQKMVKEMINSINYRQKSYNYCKAAYYEYCE